MASAAIAIALASAVVGCKTTPPPESPYAAGGPWTSKIEVLHPLVGTLWSGGSRLSFDELVARIREANVIALGHTDENPDHHRLEARILSAMLREGRSPAVLLENAHTDEQASLDDAWSRGLAALDGEFGWVNHGGVPFSAYRPLFEVAWEAKLPLVATRLPALLETSLAQGNRALLLPGELQNYGLHVPLSPEVERAFEDDLQSLGCARRDPARLPFDVDARRANLTWMATVTALQRRDVVFIASARYVRTDRGVPPLVAERAPENKRLSVAFLEVMSGLDEPSAYAAVFGEERLPFDVVWFTPRARRIGRCGTGPR